MPTVLHIIETTGPGGAETVFTDLIRTLPSRYRPIPIVAGGGWVLDRLRDIGTKPVVIPSDGRSRTAYFADLLGAVRQSRADLVHAHLMGSSVYGSIAAKLTRAKAICTLHGSVDLPQEDPYRSARFRILNATASSVVLVSESLRQHVLGCTPLKESFTRVIHNGVDVQAFASGFSGDLRAEFGIPDDVPIIGALGNVRAAKGYHVLLEAVSHLPDDQPWHLLVVGDTSGDIYPILDATLARLNLRDRVTFTGFREDVPSVLSTFDIFALSSTTEGFSLATVQALAASKPVVATRSGGPEEILADGVTGLLVPPENARALAKALQRLLSDSALRTALSSAGAGEVRRRFSLESMVSAYEHLYDSVLS